MFVVTKEKNKILSLPIKEVDRKAIKSIGSDLAFKIIKLLGKRSMYPREIAEELGVHEQKIYYHIRKLQKAGIITVTKQELVQGALAKYYGLQTPALFVKFKELEETHKIVPRSNSLFLEPFIKNGQLDAIIIVGSPDPHGPEKARSRDGYYGIDFALFLGTFLSYVPNISVRLDTEVRDNDLEKNLIVIGGPVVNKITDKINDKMPIYFDKNNHWSVVSKISGNIYPSDETGIIVRMKNPFNKDSMILLLAGKRYSGTRASIIAFIKHFKDIENGNLCNKKITAKVVEGVDLDSDGIVDDVEFRE